MMRFLTKTSNLTQNCPNQGIHNISISSPIAKRKTLTTCEKSEKDH